MQTIWNLKDGYPKKKNGMKVYSCFACGGGSTMGYKLAGFDVIGANDIDPQMAKIYKTNHNPKHYHLMDIRELVNKKDLPKEMFDLDILDGSPPCSTFSASGNREKDWGKKKQFREGQAEQTLDDLFFDFIDLAERLKPKIVIAENVKGMIQGNAKRYVYAINKAFDKAGYDTQLFLLNSAAMGVPQKRERVFFIARRKDLNLPKLKLDFKEEPIRFKDIRTDKGVTMEVKEGSKLHDLWKMRTRTDQSLRDVTKRVRGKATHFNNSIVNNHVVPNTLASGGSVILCDKPYQVYTNDLITIQSFPQDYDFTKNTYSFIKYVLGMSVPPLMTGRVAEQVYQQQLSLLSKK